MTFSIISFWFVLFVFFFRNLSAESIQKWRKHPNKFYTIYLSHTTSETIVRDVFFWNWCVSLIVCVCINCETTDGTETVQREIDTTSHIEYWAILSKIRVKYFQLLKRYEIREFIGRFAFSERTTSGLWHEKKNWSNLVISAQFNQMRQLRHENGGGRAQTLYTQNVSTVEQKRKKKKKETALTNCYPITNN